MVNALSQVPKLVHRFIRVNCNAKTTCTNSSGVKPDLGLDQNQQ